MSKSTRKPASQKSPGAHETMFRLLNGQVIAHLIHVVADLGVADAVARRALSAEVLAKQLGAHAPTLRRILRLLATMGVFSEDQKGRFKLAALGQTLITGEPGSLRDWAVYVGQPHVYSTLNAARHGALTGESAFQHAHHMNIFEYLGQHPELETMFAAAMASVSGNQNDAIAVAYPFKRIEKLVDVGGSQGHLLASILRHHRQLHGVLFDLPAVVEVAARRGLLSDPEIADRCESVGGSFFDGMPVRADCYVLKNVLHDWDDERCTVILGSCRKAMLPGGRILIVEQVLGPPDTDFGGKLFDVEMMLYTPGGCERTRKEWETLLKKSGLRLNRVIRTQCPLAIVEASTA